MSLSLACQTKRACQTKERMNLLEAIEGQTYIVKDIATDDPEMDSFLFRLGCYSGQEITVISRKRKMCIVVIKDSRYSIDNQIAEAIMI